MIHALKKLDDTYLMAGRALLGLYFLIPGIMKVTGYSGTLALMESKGVPLAFALLPLTIVLQVGLGVLLIAGKQVRLSALLLFGLTILINVFIHNFWALQSDSSYGHEMQNFIKNLAIAAGLLVLASTQKE